MGIFNKKKQENKSKEENRSSSFNEFSIDNITLGEQIRYIIADRLYFQPHGTTFSLPDVFEMPPTPEEYMEFMKFISWNFVLPVYETEEELQKAMSEDSDKVAAQKRIGYTLVTRGFIEEANSWFEKAAKSDDPEALTRVAGAKDMGYKISNELGSSIDLLRKAIIIDGYPDALLDLGLKYLHGQGLEQNNRKAFYLMTRAAKQGQKAAQFNLGHMYREGKGVAANQNMSIYWFERSANMGYENAIMYLLEYYSKNSDNNNATRILNLGLHYNVEHCIKIA